MLINFWCCFLKYRCLKERHWDAKTAAKYMLLSAGALSHTHLFKREKRIWLHHPVPSLLNVSPCVPPTAPPVIHAIINSLLSSRTGSHGVQPYLIRLICLCLQEINNTNTFPVNSVPCDTAAICRSPHLWYYMPRKKRTGDRVMALCGFTIFVLSSGHSHRRSSDHAPVHRVGDSSCGGWERQSAYLPRGHLPYQPDRTRPQQTWRTCLPCLRLWPRSGSQRQHNLQHRRRQRGREVYHWPKDRNGVVKEDGDGWELWHPHCKLGLGLGSHFTVNKLLIRNLPCIYLSPANICVGDDTLALWICRLMVFSSDWNTKTLLHGLWFCIFAKACPL